MPSLSIRQFAAAVGVVLALAGLIALMSPLEGDYDSGMFGDQSVKCGSALGPDIDAYSGLPLEACRDELSGRRAWGWPLGIAGLVVLAGALLVAPARTHPSRDES